MSGTLLIASLVALALVAVGVIILGAYITFRSERLIFVGLWLFGAACVALLVACCSLILLALRFLFIGAVL